MGSRYLIAGSLAAVALLATPPRAAAEPTITFAKERIEVSDVTPHAGVVLLVVGREQRTWSVHVLRRQLVGEDDDGDGRVSFAPDFHIPGASLWVACDLRNGAYAVSRPSGARAERLDLSETALRRDAQDRVDALATEWASMDIIVVRAGGVWRLLVSDGSRADADGKANGRSAASLASLRLIAGKRTGPDKLVPGDAVVAIDPETLRFLAGRIATGK